MKLGPRWIGRAFRKRGNRCRRRLERRRRSPNPEIDAVPRSKFPHALDRACVRPECSMNTKPISRRRFVAGGAAFTGLGLSHGIVRSAIGAQDRPTDYTLHIKSCGDRDRAKANHFGDHVQRPVSRAIAAVSSEGRKVTIEFTTTPTLQSSLHWHGQRVGPTSTAPPKKARLSFPRTASGASPSRPSPSGFRFYHTHNRAGADLAAGSTAARSARSTSSPRKSPANMIAKFFWC